MLALVEHRKHVIFEVWMVIEVFYKNQIQTGGLENNHFRPVVY